MNRIDQWIEPEKIIDSHVHLMGPPNKENLDFWVDQVKIHNLDKITLFCTSLKALKIASQYPDAIIPYLWLDKVYTNSPEFSPNKAYEILNEAIEKFPVRGIKLYPCTGYDPAQEAMHPIYRLAEEKRLTVSFHMGISSAKKMVTMKFMNPEILIPIIEEFQRTNFLFAHFATGYFQELVRLLHQYDNVYAETSSSNSWMKLSVQPLDLTRVFEKCIEIAGTKRIIFGTDSMDTTRGWRSSLYKAQLAVCNSLELNQGEINQIFYKNFDSLISRSKRNIPSFDQYLEIASDMVKESESKETKLKKES